MSCVGLWKNVRDETAQVASVLVRPTGASYSPEWPLGLNLCVDDVEWELPLATL